MIVDLLECLRMVADVHCARLATDRSLLHRGDAWRLNDEETRRVGDAIRRPAFDRAADGHRVRSGRKGPHTKRWPQSGGTRTWTSVMLTIGPRATSYPISLS